MCHPLMRLPAESIRVMDADEEIFLLYSQATATRLGSAGLGSLDTRKDEIVLSLDVRPRQHKNRIPSNLHDESSETVEVRLVQDITSLRSRAGDTGSVIWRASIEFAKVILADILYPTDNAVFDAERLKDIAVLELGSGTGVLGVLLAPCVGNYVLTDLPELVPLMEKNINYNFPEHRSGVLEPAKIMRSIPGRPPKSRKLRMKPSATPTKAGKALNIAAQPLDWVDIASTPAGSSARSRACSHIRRLAQKEGTDCPSFDLILAVDTLYNTALTAPFLAVLDEFASKGNVTPEGSEVPLSTLVIIICELRDEDVLRGFLESWLNVPGWEIWRLGGTGAEREADDNDITGMAFMQGPFVVWAGWKIIKDSRLQ